MVQALAPRMLRGCSWFWLAVICIVLAGAHPAIAQNDATKGAAKKDAPKAAADEGDGDGEDQGVVKSDQTKKRDSGEVFKDPRVAAAMPNTFPALPYPNPRFTERDIPLLRSMAGGQAQPDRTLISRQIDTMIAELTNHANIKAVIDPAPTLSPNSATVRALEVASKSLIDTLLSARANKNEAFLSIYVPLLATKLPPLLENHLLARIEASIILAMAASPTSIDVFIKQINDPKQVVWVKLWAARGLTNLTNNGSTILDVVKGSAAEAGLVAFLMKEPEAPWPVKIRMFEAMGCLRLVSTGGPQGKPDVPDALLRFITDPSMKLEARAWAAWALGMITVPASVSRYNFGLEAYHIGRLTADIGDRIGAEYDAHGATFTKNADQARALTSLILYQVLPSLEGEPSMRDSGLLNSRHPAMSASIPMVKGLEEQIKNVGRAAVDLLNAGGAQGKEMRGILGNRVAELNSFLAKNPPKDTQLTPGGLKFPVLPAQVAGGPAAAK